MQSLENSRMTLRTPSRRTDRGTMRGQGRGLLPGKLPPHRHQGPGPDLDIVLDYEPEEKCATRGDSLLDEVCYFLMNSLYDDRGLFRMIRSKAAKAQLSQSKLETQNRIEMLYIYNYNYLI